MRREPEGDEPFPVFRNLSGCFPHYPHVRAPGCAVQFLLLRPIFLVYSRYAFQQDSTGRTLLCLGTSASVVEGTP
jgi:hypothetical protein